MLKNETFASVNLYAFLPSTNTGNEIEFSARQDFYSCLYFKKSEHAHKFKIRIFKI